MVEHTAQVNLFAGIPLQLDSTQHALDELFRLTYQYKTSRSFHEMLQFIARFRSYSPFNAMLVHIQMPGARFVAPPNRWLREHGRTIRPQARPLAILQPMGPVMFVFDVSDTEPGPNAPSLPRAIEAPFEVRGTRVTDELRKTIENAKRDGVRVEKRSAGSQSAGQIQMASGHQFQRFQIQLSPEPQYIDIPVQYDVLVNASHSPEVQYATLVHELAHLYCGHLGTPNPRWWPDRQALPALAREFEAESVSYLVCRRLGIDSASEEYLAGYVSTGADTPPISLECVMTVAGLIEKMGRERMKPRKSKTER